MTVFWRMMNDIQLKIVHFLWVWLLHIAWWFFVMQCKRKSYRSFRAIHIRYQETKCYSFHSNNYRSNTIWLFPNWKVSCLTLTIKMQLLLLLQREKKTFRSWIWVYFNLKATRVLHRTDQTSYWHFVEQLECIICMKHRLLGRKDRKKDNHEEDRKKDSQANWPRAFLVFFFILTSSASSRTKFMYSSKPYIKQPSIRNYNQPIQTAISRYALSVSHTT